MSQSIFSILFLCCLLSMPTIDAAHGNGGTPPTPAPTQYLSESFCATFTGNGTYPYCHTCLAEGCHWCQVSNKNNSFCYNGNPSVKTCSGNSYGPSTGCQTVPVDVVALIVLTLLWLLCCCLPICGVIACVHRYRKRRQQQQRLDQLKLAEGTPSKSIQNPVPTTAATTGVVIAVQRVHEPEYIPNHQGVQMQTVSAQPVYGAPQSTVVVIQPQRQLQIQIPPGAASGSMLQVSTPEGAILNVTIPEGMQQGQTFSVDYKQI